MIEPSVLVPQLVFYIFASILVMSALRVVTARNPVHSVLFLILSFFTSAGLFVLLGAEFIAMLLVIVYVGAVAVLFLFVVMMLNIRFSGMQKQFVRYVPIGLLIAGIMLAELIFVVMHTTAEKHIFALAESPIVSDMHNTESLGMILYTNYAYAFEMAGLILLVAMVGAITLSVRVRPGVRKQVVSKQVAREPKRAIEIKKIAPGKGTLS